MRNSPILSPPRKTQHGATLVEFVIVFPLAVLFVLGLIQFGFLYMAKLQVNHATFMAARAGSMANANPDVMRETLVRGLNAFYEQGATTSDISRIGVAYGSAELHAKLPGTLTIDVMNPSAAAFKDFGVADPDKHVTYIPNDNLEWRSTANGGTSKMNIRDANLLKLHVVYAYDLKVPLMASVLKRLMCGGSTGVAAWGNVSMPDAQFLPTSKQCLLYYDLNRMPIESYAIVEMQSRAEKK